MLRTFHNPSVNEAAERARVTRIAQEWLRTPYLRKQELKGVGCDCATFINGVFGEAGLFHEDLGQYPPNGANARREQIYMIRLLRHAGELVQKNAGAIASPRPGDIVLAVTANSEIFDHGAIVLAWPWVIHAFPTCVQKSMATCDPRFAGREVKFFSFWKPNV